MFEEPQMLKKDGVLTPSGTHCFLGIVKHEEGQAPEILEELHFRRPRRGDTTRVQPVVYRESRHDFEDPELKNVCHQIGEKDEIYGKWNKALKLARMVRDNPPRFENTCAHSFNCRAYAIAGLKAMGFDYVRAAANDQKGRLAQVWQTYSPAYDEAPDAEMEDNLNHLVA